MTPEQAVQKFHWIKYDDETNTIELFLDHHMLSWARMCEAGFFFEHILQVRPNYGKIPATKQLIIDGQSVRVYDTNFQGIKKYTENRKPWFLDFGEYLHYMFELFYTSFIHLDKENYVFDNLLKTDQECLNLQDFLEIGRKVWDIMDMDWYKTSTNPQDTKKYEEVGGFTGVIRLLTEYYVYYMDLRIRVVDTEIIFGYNREVPIGEFFVSEPYNWLTKNPCRGDELRSFTVKCYLVGRIDLLIDNGRKIGPVDHKSAHRFDGNEADKFNPQDGITGYIYATRCLLQTNYPKYFDKGRESLSGWIYHISATDTPEPNKNSRSKGKTKQDRFKCTTIDKTPSQLEDFKQRQLSTFKRVCELLFNNKTPEWNTLVCNNIFGRPCQFREIHRQSSEEWEHIIKDHFVIGKQWNPQERDSDKIDKILKEKKEHAVNN